jgi:predicted nucleic acid-binding protein
MDKILVDTSVIVRYLKTNDGILPDILGSYTLLVSVVTLTELLASAKAADQKAKAEMRNFLVDNFQIVPLSEEIALHAADIVRGQDATLAQSYIAATSIKHDAPLLTYELKVFDAVPDLQLIDL